MKTLKPAVALAVLLLLPLLGLTPAPPPSARADLIKVSTPHYKDLLVTDASGNNVLGLTTASFTATASANGGARTTITTPAITESGQGHYWALIPASQTGTVGVLSIVLTTSSGTVQTDSKDDVVPADFSDVATASAQATTAAAGIATANTGIAANTTTLGTVNTNTGTILTNQGTNATNVAGIKAKTDLLPSVAAGAAGGLPTGDASGRVLLQPTQAGVTIPTVTTVGTLTANNDKSGYSGLATNFVAAPTVAQIQAYLDANSALPGLVWTQATRTVTGGTVTASNVPAFPTNFPLLAVNSSGQVTTSNPVSGGSAVTEATIWAYGNRSLTDKANFTLASGEYANIAAAVLASVIDGTVTLKQASALNLAYNYGGYTRVKAGSTQTLTFTNRAGQTIATSVSALDSNGNPTGRTSVTFSNLQ